MIAETDAHKQNDSKKKKRKKKLSRKGNAHIMKGAIRTHILHSLYRR